MKPDNAVSQVVGAIILIAIAVIAVGIILLVLLSGPLPTDIPSFSGLISNSSKTVYISHEGGDPLRVGQFRILVDNVDETWNFTKSITGTFSAGKVMNATLPRMPARVVMVFNTSWGGGTVLLSADLLKGVVVTPYNWYSGDWRYRKKITINHAQVASDLADFPVLIKLDDLDLDDTEYVRSDGYDLLFTASDGKTLQPYEIEYFARNGGHLVAWVKVPSLSSTVDTVLYMYYGNPGAPNQQSPANVWDGSFKGVWHMKEEVAGTGTSDVYQDSTSNNNDADDYISATGLSGKIGSGHQFDGTDDYARVPDPGGSWEFANGGLDAGTSDFSISAWIWLSSSYVGNYPTPVAKGGGSDPNPGYWIDYYRNDDVIEYRFSDGIHSRFIPSSSPLGLTKDTWHYMYAVMDRAAGIDTGYFYLDGNPVGSQSSTNVAGNSATGYMDFFIGSYDSTGGRWMGNLDEVRISSTVRSAQWVATEYANQNSPGTFVSVSTEQTQQTMS